MPLYHVVLSPEVATQVAAIQAWWLANRPVAPRLFVDELRSTFLRLRRHPHAGTPYAPLGVRATRRMVMPRTRYLVFYTVDDSARLVRVYAVWHAAQRDRPVPP